MSPTDVSDALRSDTSLLAEVADVIRRPRQEPADSFVLHAPLELVARAALLPWVAPGRQEAARDRLAELAHGFAGAGPAVAEPAPEREWPDLHSAARALAAATAVGDLDEVDAAAAWLGRHARPGQIRRLLAEDMVPRLSAAGHGPIFLFQLPRVSPRGELTGELLRPLARELARQPGWRLTWHEHRPAPAAREGGGAGPNQLLDAVRATPALGVPGSEFIFPLMSQAEGSGVAAELLSIPTATVSLADGARALLRAAAWSMLQEPPDHAPYGWTHCLTMPQAVLGVADACADPSAALAVAATYVVGFRAALAQRPLVPAYAPEATGLPVQEALATSPATAAATVWHLAPPDLPAAVTEIVSRAAAQPDAHFVKYTLACLDAAAWDRSHARLYLSAAAHLAAFWTGQDPS
jgi:hypothetical protein